MRTGATPDVCREASVRRGPTYSWARRIPYDKLRAPEVQQGGSTDVTTNTQGWRPVKPGVERVVTVDDDSGPVPLFELQIHLEDGPADGEWADLFRASPIIKAGDRSMMESEPVLVGAV